MNFLFGMLSQNLPGSAYAARNIVPLEQHAVLNQRLSRHEHGDSSLRVRETQEKSNAAMTGADHRDERREEGEDNGQGEKLDNDSVLDIFISFSSSILAFSSSAARQSKHDSSPSETAKQSGGQTQRKTLSLCARRSFKCCQHSAPRLF
jgi:hypothetical protein